MNLSIRMRFIYNVKRCCAIRLKFRDKILNFSNQVSAQSESQYLLYNKRKSAFILSHVFGICCLSYFNIFLQQGLYHKETPFLIETANFTIESLASQNSYLNGAPSISYIKLPRY